MAEAEGNIVTLQRQQAYGQTYQQALQMKPEDRAKAFADVTMYSGKVSVVPELDAKGLPASQVLKLALEEAEKLGHKWPVRYEIK